MNSQGAAALNGSPDSSSSPPPAPPRDPGGHNHQASTSDSEGGEANGTTETDSLQPSSSTPSPYMSMRERLPSITTLTSSLDIEAANHHHHHHQAVRRSPIRGEALLNLCVQAVFVIIQIHFQQVSSTTSSESLPMALGVSMASFAFGFTFTLIGMFFRGVNAAAESVMEALGFLSTLLGVFLMMGMCLSQRFGGIIAWPLVAVLFLVSASAYATYK